MPEPRITQEVPVEEPMEGDESGKTVTVLRPLGEVFCRQLAIGHDPELVCDQLGVAPSTYYLWMHHGRNAANKIAVGEELTGNEAIYLGFLEEAQRARGNLKRRLEARLAELVPTMESREVTDALARLDKVKWSKASSMKLDISGEINVVEQHGNAVAKLVKMLIDGLLAHDSIDAAREAAPEVVRRALAEVVAPSPSAQVIEAQGHRKA